MIVSSLQATLKEEKEKHENEIHSLTTEHKTEIEVQYLNTLCRCTCVLACVVCYCM